MTKTTLLTAMGCLLATMTMVLAADIPPKTSKPLSQIIKSIEDQKLGVITQVEFDDGLWEIEVHNGDKEIDLYIDPKTGKIERRQHSTDRHEVLPPQGSKPLSEIVQSVEKQNVGVITEIEFDDGLWEVTARREGVKVKMNIEPKSGKRQSS